MCLGNGAVKLINITTIQAKDKLKTNCTIPNKKFVLSLHYDVKNDIYLLTVFNNTNLKPVMMKLELITILRKYFRQYKVSLQSNTKW